MFTSQKLYFSNHHNDLIARLKEIAGKFTISSDFDNANKMQELVKKFQQEEITIAFCGHFSSGKSSIINYLLGSEILPTSPIPSKSNIIKIANGNQNAKIYLKDKTVQELSFEDNIDTLQKYSSDIQNVEHMEIFHESHNSSIQTMSLLDTPGVDSIEDAREIAYDTSLYLSDVIIYVMDYNHVQSEVNFNFTKLFKDLGKPVYLVINQIDKHCDFEIDFEFFKDSVINAFDSWNIKPEGIFFTSLTESSHPENQIQELRTKIAEFYANKASLVVKSTVDAAVTLIKSHIKNIEESKTAEKEQYLSLTKDADLIEINMQLNDIKDKIASLENKIKNFETALRKETFELLESARIAPYQTRELAREYLDSRRDGFKVGFLFAGKKTQEEVENRLQALYKDFSEKVNANLNWHIKEVLRKVPDKYGVTNEEYLNMLYSLNVEITSEMLQASVKIESAGSREYVINYCNDISNEVKTQYRQKINVLIVYLADIAHQKIATNLTELQQKAANFESIIEAGRKLSMLDSQRDDYQNALEDILLGRIA